MYFIAFWLKRLTNETEKMRNYYQLTSLNYVNVRYQNYDGYYLSNLTNPHGLNSHR